VSRPAGPDVLLGAADSVARLGRLVCTRTAAPTDSGPPDSGPSDSGPTGARRRPPFGSESGPGLPPAAGGGAGPGPHDSPATAGPVRFAAVITTVEPSALGWVRDLPWADLLNPAGTLAVITHSDSRGGWLIDPTAELTEAAGGGRVAPVDRIVLLEIPILGALSDDSVTPARDGSDVPLTGHKVARRVHSDLLLYAPLPGDETGVRRSA